MHHFAKMFGVFFSFHFYLWYIVYSASLPVIEPIPTYPFDLHQRMDRPHNRAREDHFPMAQRQTRSNPHVFAKYPREIYPRRRISYVHYRHGTCLS